MSHRISNAEMDALLQEMTGRAITLGLIPPGSRIWFTNGGGAYSHVMSVMEPDARYGSDYQVSFLPQFTRSTTKTQAYRELVAANNVLGVLAGRLQP